MHDILIKEDILARNDELAGEVRRELKSRRIFSINMVSSPGSGKTSLIEKTLERIKDRISVAVIEGDIQTDLDAQRIGAHGVPVRQINTGRACHLDAHQIHHSMEWVRGHNGLGLLIIENVGNMVCPAEFDLGEDQMVVVMSATEGDDKPLKYPSIFDASDVLVINKTDLVPYTDFSIERAVANAKKINPALRVFETSCTTGAGIDEWAGYIMSCAGLPGS